MKQISFQECWIFIQCFALYGVVWKEKKGRILLRVQF